MFVFGMDDIREIDPSTVEGVGGRRASDAQVVYSVRELLDQIRLTQADGFARLESSLRSKADKGDIARLDARLNEHSGRMDRHEHRLNGLEGRMHDDELTEQTREKEVQTRWSTRKKVLAVLASLGGIAATFLGPWAATHIH